MADMLMDLVTRNVVLSFIDRHSNYNKIFILEKDVSKIAFRCLGSLGTYEWVVVST